MMVLSVFVLLTLIAATACEPTIFGFFVSMTDEGTTEDGLDYDTNDILFIIPDDITPTWVKFFDGDLNGLKPKHNINAFSFNELILHETFTTTVSADVYTGTVELYLNFSQNRIKVPGITGNVYGQDIVRYTGDVVDSVPTWYEYDMFFDGSDVGLTTVGEKLDGISYWPPEYYMPLADDVVLPYDCNAGVLFLTTAGSYRVPNNQDGFLIGDGSDVLAFCAVNLGPDTAGFWFRAFDGSDAEIWPRNAGYGIDVFYVATPEPDEDSGDLEDLDIAFWFTAKKPFSSICSTADQSQLNIGGAEQGDDCTVGPFVDFETGEGINGLEFPGTGGLVDSVGVFDYPGDFAP
jgi:hypothetical protein